MDMDKRLIGIRIMQRRKENGMTQEELSEQIGVSKNHISSIERGKYTPTTEFIFKICNILGGTPDYYLIGRISDSTEEIIELFQKLPDSAQKMTYKLIETYLQNYNNLA